MKKLAVEVWKSDQNQEEIHYFKPGEQNEYVIGYNPKYFTKEQIEKILENCPKL